MFVILWALSTQRVILYPDSVAASLELPVEDVICAHRYILGSLLKDVLLACVMLMDLSLRIVTSILDNVPAG